MKDFLNNNGIKGFLYGVNLILIGTALSTLFTFISKGRVLHGIILFLCVMLLAVGVLCLSLFIDKSEKNANKANYDDVKGVNRFAIIMSFVVYFSFGVLAVATSFSGSDTLLDKYSQGIEYLKDKGSTDGTLYFMTSWPRWVVEPILADAQCVAQVQDLINDGHDIESQIITDLLDRMDMIKRNSRVLLFITVGAAWIAGMFYSFSRRTSSYIEFRKRSNKT